MVCLSGDVPNGVNSLVVIADKGNISLLIVQRFFKNNPMLILAFPLMVGIAVSWLCGIQMLAAIILLVFSSVAMIAAFLWQGGVRWMFGVTLIAAFFSLGVLSEVLDRKQYEPQWSSEKGRFEAVLLETPHVGGKATRVKAVATRLGRDSILNARREGIVNLYFENNVSVEALKVGNKIFFEGRVESPRNAGNPAEFDNKHYMYVQGVTGSAYLGNKGWVSRGTVELTFPMRAMKFRERIVQKYASLGMSPESESLLSALTVGEKRDLSKGVRNLYAAVGASHVLALSGLHLGILYMIITFLLPVGSNRLPKVLREGVLLLLLWGFAAVAGFTPSVVRAALLFTLMSLARCLHRDGSSLNSLAFAALVMLLVNPRWLMDIGFQLSFLAVFSILLLVPMLDKLFGTYERGVLYRYLAGVVSVSVAAQIGTLPFVWYYFGTFPLYFLLTNFVVVPSAFVIMLFAVFLLLLFPVEACRNVISLFLDGLISSVNSLLRFIESLPASSLELPDIGAWGAIAVAVAIAAAVYAFVDRKWRYMMVSGVVLASIAIQIIYTSCRDIEPHILFYNNSDFSAVQLVESRSSSYLLSSYSQYDVDAQHIVGPYCQRENIAEPKLIAGCCYNDYSCAAVTVAGGLVTFCGRRIKILSDDCWKDETLIEPVDCILLCRGFSGSIKELLMRYPARYVLLDGTLYAVSVKRILRECKEQGVRCVNLRNAGARKMLVRGTGVRLLPVH